MLSIVALQDGYRRRAFSPVEVVESLLTRIEQLNPLVNAFTTVSAEPALAQARRCEQEMMQADALGPLHGIPFAAKDIYDTAGIRTTYGSLLFADHVPAEDATAVRRLKQVGAILLGKTATHEFAWGITTTSAAFGVTRNPWDQEYVAGGSSGGSAVALATGMVPAALGTDTGGSIRIPASLCGIVGLKPTYQRVSTEGVFPLAPSLDHAGPMARTVGDAALLLNVLAGYEPGDPSTACADVPDYTDGLTVSLSGVRIGLCPDLLAVALSPTVQRAFDDCVALLRKLGASIVEVDLPIAGLIYDAYTAIQHAEAYHVHHYVKGLFPAEAARYGTDVARRLEAAGGVELSRYLEARQVQRRVLANFMRLFTQQIDILVTPIAAAGPIKIKRDGTEHAGHSTPFRNTVMPYTTPQDLAGIPACAVRAGFDDRGLPIGLQFSGRPWAEELVLRVGHAFAEATADLQNRWPALVENL